MRGGTKIFPPDLGKQMARIARDVIAERESEGVSTRPETVARKTLLAPAINQTRALSEAGSLTSDTLELSRASDGHLYAPYTDYYEDRSEGSPGFVNLQIPEGTELIAEWIHAEPDPEAYTVREFRPAALSGAWVAKLAEPGAALPATRREGERVFLRGVIASEAGAVEVGTQLFTVDAEHRPDEGVSLPTMTDAGPVVIEVSTEGVATLGAGPFVAGNERLLLDSLSWPSAISAPLPPTFEHWGQENIFFGDDALNVSYGGLN